MALLASGGNPYLAIISSPEIATLSFSSKNNVVCTVGLVNVKLDEVLNRLELENTDDTLFDEICLTRPTYSVLTDNGLTGVCTGPATGESTTKPSQVPVAGVIVNVLADALIASSV